MVTMRNLQRQKVIFISLLVLILALGSLNLAKAKGWLIPSQLSPEIHEHTIYLDSLSTEQKIAQMVVVAGSSQNMLAWKRMQLGGIHVFAMQDAQVYQNLIFEFQQDSSIPFLVSVDLEGCISPFASFRNFTYTKNIHSTQQAYTVGAEEGKFLSSLGVTLNFAPVVDLQDTIWGCRTFPGNETSIAQLAQAYVLGLQSQQILATAKHYPGKTLVVRDPHKFLVTAEIDERDLYPYAYLTPDVNGIMVTHIIPSGALQSDVPAVANPLIIGALQQNFSGLIITDEINMLGLKKFYPTLDDVYVAVFSAGNDLILNFNEDPNEIHHMIQVISQAVDDGRISQARIDASVRRILEAKGLKVVG